MFDDGSNGDVGIGDNTFTFSHFVPGVTVPAFYPLPWTATDSISRVTNGSISLTAIALPPANDVCAIPIALALGVNGPFSNLAATDGGVLASAPPATRMSGSRTPQGARGR